MNFQQTNPFHKKIKLTTKKFLLGGIDKKLNGTWHMVAAMVSGVLLQI